MSNNSGASSSSRVSIPNNVRKTIQHIKEITSNHSEEDIYAMLKECSMDPNETTQRLLHLDTFREVKRKQNKRKETVKSKSDEESRWRPLHQGRGTRRNSFSPHTSNDAGGRRTAAFCKESGVEGTEKGSMHSPAPVSKKSDSIQPRNREKLSCIIMDGPLGLPNGSLSGGGSDSGDVQSSKTVETSLSKKNVDASADNVSSTVGKVIAESAPSALDHMLVPSCDSWVSGIGAVTQEVRVQDMSAETSLIVPADGGRSCTEFVSKNDLNEHESQNINSPLVSSSPSEKQLFDLVKVAQPKVSSECLVAEKSHVPDSVTVAKPSLPQGVKDATTKLEKLKFSDGQHVIIPRHIQVPDAVKNILSFGSLDANFGLKENGVNSEGNDSSNPAAELANAETVSKCSSCDQEAVSPASQTNHSDHPRSPLHLPGKYIPVDAEVSSSVAVSKDDQPKQENLPAVGPPFPVVQTTPSYNFGFMPPMLANVLVQPEGFESQAHVLNSLGGSSPATSASTPPLPQSAGAGQSSVAVPPQPIPLFRQPYPPNYIPYNHYYSPFFIPPTMHQYFGHTAFPPPLPTGAMYLPPPTAAPGMKPAPYKPGTNTGSHTPVGMPSGFGAYNNSQVGYSQNASVTSSSSNSEDVGTPALKENNIHPGQQSEGSAVWVPAATGHDTASFPMNSVLNLPHGQQHVLTPQSVHGGFAIYHALQPMGGPAPGLPLLQQSQPMAGPVESVGPPSNSYQQQPQRHQQINWNM